MLRSLGVVLLGAMALWFFGQAAPGDAKTVRVVSSRDDVAAWRSAVPAAPLPTAPAGWQQTVSQFTGQPAALRLGWLTPDRRYVEFSASTAPAARFLAATAGTPQGPVPVSGPAGPMAWQRYVDGNGSVSLVRTAGGVTVVVGTARGSAPEPVLVALAGTVTP